MSRDRAIEICNNLVSSINRIEKEKVYTENKVFKSPTATRKLLINKLNLIKSKHKIEDQHLAQKIKKKQVYE
jgi:hypothetical protein